MKRKLVCFLLMIMLLAGCRKVPEPIPGVENMTEDRVVSEEGTMTYEPEEESEPEQEAYVLEFEAVTTEGESVSSACFADSKLTMLNVWATYCSPCLQEMPDLGEIAASYDKAEFQMMGIVSDVMEGGDEEMLEEAKSLIEQTGADYPHLLTNESLYTNLLGSVTAVPTTFFVNQKGEVLGYLVGAYAKEDWEAMIDELLATVE